MNVASSRIVVALKTWWPEAGLQRAAHSGLAGSKQASFTGRVICASDHILWGLASINILVKVIV